MKTLIFTIDGRLPGLNEITSSARYNRFAGANLKKKTTQLCQIYIKKSRPFPFVNPISVELDWIEPNLKRDPDNIMAGCKFIFDALVEEGVIPNDTRKWVKEIKHNFKTPDKLNPKVIVYLKEFIGGE